jgi:hypothetical protein
MAESAEEQRRIFEEKATAEEREIFRLHGAAGGKGDEIMMSDVAKSDASSKEKKPRQVAHSKKANRPANKQNLRELASEVANSAANVCRGFPRHLFLPHPHSRSRLLTAIRHLSLSLSLPPSLPPSLPLPLPPHPPPPFPLLSIFLNKTEEASLGTSDSPSATPRASTRSPQSTRRPARSSSAWRYRLIAARTSRRPKANSHSLLASLWLQWRMGTPRSPEGGLHTRALLLR